MMLDSRYDTLVLYLAGLQAEMQDCGIWSLTPPSAQALMSEQPFCVDTLPFEQWLQFVMIPKFNWMMAENMALPNQCQITPMAQEAFKTRQLNPVLVCLQSIDELLTVS